MLITTTPTVQGHEITKYLGVVCGEVVVGAHIGKDILASFTNIVGGRSNAYESTLRETRNDHQMATIRRFRDRAGVWVAETEEEANQLIEELNNGADFATLAEEHSQDPGSAQRGGEVSRKGSPSITSRQASGTGGLPWCCWSISTQRAGSGLLRPPVFPMSTM